MEKPEDDSPLRAEGDVMMPLTRVPLASGSFQVRSRQLCEGRGQEGLGREVAAVLDKGLFLSEAPSPPRGRLLF